MDRPVRHERRLVCCFDGTGNNFGEDDSNVVRLFRALEKDSPENQLVYYQSGIGTDTTHSPTSTFSTLASKLDQAIALRVNDHVKEGYKFVMRNYKDGDKICLFGFSRGALVARVVAGMLYTIGVLPPYDEFRVDFAFSLSQVPGKRGHVLCRDFRQTFSRPAAIEFIGVWDTVSSVGIFPRYHNNTSINCAVKHVRHAMALDERRARFRPLAWNQPIPNDEQGINIYELPMQDKRDSDWVFEPAVRADVKEVWFAGSHGDVGGGPRMNETESLSQLTFKWMIKECFVTQSGIMFNYNYLSTQKVNLDELSEGLARLGINVSALRLDKPSLDKLKCYRRELGRAYERPMGGSQNQSANASDHPGDYIDSLAVIWDQLSLKKAWFILEHVPMLSAYQDEDGDWWFVRRRNRGQGRFIPFGDDKLVLVHDSVRLRMSMSVYRPAAINWQSLEDSGMIKYVT